MYECAVYICLINVGRNVVAEVDRGCSHVAINTYMENVHVCTLCNLDLKTSTWSARFVQLPHYI
jgi:hypothetical protein